MSYAEDPGDANAFLVWADNTTDNLWVYVGDQLHQTTVPTSSLIDGNNHALAVSWDSASGDLNIYVDGSRL